VASLFGTEHHELVLEPDVVPLVDDFAWFLDEPFGDTSAIATYMVSKLAAEHVKVVLTGDGGDEILPATTNTWSRIASAPTTSCRRPASRGRRGRCGDAGRMRGRRFLRHLALNGARRYLDAQSIVHPDELGRLFTPEAGARMAAYDPWAASIEQLGGAPDWISAVQYGDLQNYLPLDVLTKVDRMTMAHSIEAQAAPARSQPRGVRGHDPAELRYRDGTTKYLFKQALRGVLPRFDHRSPEAGVRGAAGALVPRAAFGYAHDMLLSATQPTAGRVEPAAVERKLLLHQRGRDLDLQLWTMLSFELWCRRFLDGEAVAA
jgi:asparagine synthase (glutamine-hydrolysing)